MPTVYSQGEETILPDADRINMEKEAKLIKFFGLVVVLWPKLCKYLTYGRSQLKMRPTVVQKTLNSIYTFLTILLKLSLHIKRLSKFSTRLQQVQVGLSLTLAHRLMIHKKQMKTKNQAPLLHDWVTEQCCGYMLWSWCKNLGLKSVLLSFKRLRGEIIKRLSLVVGAMDFIK